MLDVSASDEHARKETSSSNVGNTGQLQNIQTDQTTEVNRVQNSVWCEGGRTPMRLCSFKTSKRTRRSHDGLSSSVHDKFFRNCEAIATVVRAFLIVILHVVLASFPAISFCWLVAEKQCVSQCIIHFISLRISP